MEFFLMIRLDGIMPNLKHPLARVFYVVESPGT